MTRPTTHRPSAITKASALKTVVVVAGLLTSLGGCRGAVSEQPPIVPVRNMHENPRYDAQSGSNYFQDGRSMRPPVEHAVAQEMEVDPAIDTGVQDDGTYLMVMPQSVTQAFGGGEQLLARGQDRYGIYCVPCHGGVGDGAGLVPEVSGVGAIRPPTFHGDRIRQMPDGQLYSVIRNGIRNMPPYRAQMPVQDRWAIVAYVRALQLNQLDGRTAAATTERVENNR